MYELKPWKQPNCTLAVTVAKVTNRESFSREINEERGEGGALNAGYDTAEALVEVSNQLGLAGLENKKDFVFKTGHDEITFDFLNAETRDAALAVLQRDLGDVAHIPTTGMFVIRASAPVAQARA